MDRYAMQAFVAVVEAVSLVSAADELGMSKTSMPCLIVDLEHTSAPPPSENHPPDAPDGGGSLQLSDLEEQSPKSSQQRQLAPLLPQYRNQYLDVQLEVSLTNHLVDPVNDGFDLTISGPDSTTAPILHGIWPLSARRRLCSSAWRDTDARGIDCTQLPDWDLRCPFGNVGCLPGHHHHHRSPGRRYARRQ
jgi:DNA-binding transcriptional LysR family regulator